MNRSMVDVAVVGGGIVGAASAYYAARAGASVALFEKDDLAMGASGRNPGFVWLHTRRQGAALDLALYGRSLYDRLAEELDVDFEFRPTGGMIFFYTDEQAQVMKEFVEARVAAGLDMSLLDAREARTLAPALSPDVSGATYCPLDAHIRTAKLVEAFARAAQHKGAAVYRGAEVLEVGADGRVETTQGGVNAEAVVIAAGAWTPFLCRRLGFEVPIRPMRLQMVATASMDPSLQCLLYGPAAAAQYDLFHGLPSYRQEYFRTPGHGDFELPFLELACQRTDGRFLLGCPMDFAGFNWDPDLRGVALTCRELPKHLPVLRAASFDRAWAGLLPHTPDTLPIIDRAPGLDRIFVASGHVFGNVAGPPTGALVAALVTQRDPPIDPAPFRLDRPELRADSTSW